MISTLAFVLTVSGASSGGWGLEDIEELEAED